MISLWAGAPFTPASLANLAAWYRFNRGITQAGGFASQWDDQTGNGRHLTQATGASQPAVQGDGSLLFDGTDDSMAATSWSQGEPVTYFIRYMPVSWTGSDAIVDGNPTGTSGKLEQSGVSPNVRATTDNAALLGPTAGPAIGAYGTNCCLFNGASSLLQTDLNAAVTGSLVADTMGGIRIGARAAATNCSNIQVKEVIVYNAALSQTDINRVMTYLSTL